MYIMPQKIFLKISWRVGSIAQAMEHLPSKHQVLQKSKK
jgi:hypothetical protein